MNNIKCCSEGFQPLANALVELYSKLIDEKQIVTQQKLEYKNFIDVQVKLFYNYEQYKYIYYIIKARYLENYQKILTVTKILKQSIKE